MESNVRATSFILPAVMAGMSAALASVFAKLFSDSRTSSFLQAGCQKMAPKLSNRDTSGFFSWLMAGNEQSWEQLLGGTIVGRILSELIAYACVQVSDVRIIFFIRIICFALIFIANGAMWSFFTRALNNSRHSSVPVVVVNSATNFIMTSILGRILFKEPLSLQWYIGAFFIVIGTVLSSHEPQRKTKRE